MPAIGHKARPNAGFREGIVVFRGEGGELQQFEHLKEHGARMSHGLISPVDSAG